jgi:hypothetical protein
MILWRFQKEYMKTTPRQFHILIWAPIREMLAQESSPGMPGLARASA